MAQVDRDDAGACYRGWGSGQATGTNKVTKVFICWKTVKAPS